MSASAGSGDGQSDNTVLSQYKILTLTFNQDCTYDYLELISQNKIMFSIIEHWQWAQ
jgi:hypothetical protein